MRRVMETAAALAEAIAESDVYQRLTEAEAACRADGSVVRTEAALQGASPNEQRQAEERLQSEPAYQRYLSARRDFDDMMDSVNELLHLRLGTLEDGGRPACGGCCGSCDRACGHRQEVQYGNQSADARDEE